MGKTDPVKILGIETSCDETGVSIVEDGKNILSNIVATQFEFHEKYAGVVPEIASRRHHEVINHVIEEAFVKGNTTHLEIDAIAVASHPGLIGSLLVGMIASKAISMALEIPLIGINHIEAHLYSVHFNNEVKYPLIGLVISGGHTLLTIADKIGSYRILGSTLDDAIGEAFDKVAKALGLGYPGGPEIQNRAVKGSEKAYEFPRVTLDGGRDRYNFSYSGLKNAVINQRKRFKMTPGPETVEDIAASFQAAATDVLLTKVRWIARDFGINRVAVVGGVANNARVKRIFMEADDLEVYFPSPPLTADNGAMIAGLGYHKLIEGKIDDLTLEPVSRLKEIKKGKRSKNGN